MITYSFLQHYWWFLISLLAGILAFLLFVQGGQTMLFSLAKNERERSTLVNALGRKWEYTFTTLVTFGGAFFASFPMFYSTSFSGAYWVWMLILLCFVLQAVSYEYQSRPNNVFGKKTYQGFLFFNGLAGTFLIGAALATFFTGSDFIVNRNSIADLIAPTISRWGNEWHGLDALAEPRCWLLGLAVFFLARTLACLFFINRLKDETLVERSRKALFTNGIPFLIFFLAFVIWTFIAKGYVVNPETDIVSLEPHKYLYNLLEMPIVGIVFLAGVLLVLFGLGKSMFDKNFTKGIWFAGLGTVLTVCMLLLTTGYNNTAYYPSSTNLNSSLTIQNSCSSEFTLTAMSVVSLLVPIVLAYIVYAWHSLEKKKFDIKNAKEDGHVY